MRQRWCVLVLLTVMASARGGPLTGTPRQAKVAERLQEGNEMPGLHLFRQKQCCEKHRTFTAKAPGSYELKPLDVSLHQVILLPFSWVHLYNLGLRET